MSVQFAESSSSSSKPSIAELASFASKAMEIGGSDDIIELGDDLGMGLLANQGKVAPIAAPAAPSAKTSAAPGDDFGFTGKLGGGFGADEFNFAKFLDDGPADETPKDSPPPDPQP
jgi:hypothetical protein